MGSVREHNFCALGMFSGRAADMKMSGYVFFYIAARHRMSGVVRRAEALSGRCETHVARCKMWDAEGLYVGKGPMTNDQAPKECPCAKLQGVAVRRVPSDISNAECGLRKIWKPPLPGPLPRDSGGEGGAHA